MPESSPKAYPTRTPDAEAAHPLGYAAQLTRVIALLLLWAWEELNLRPHAYQACALTT